MFDYEKAIQLTALRNREELEKNLEDREWFFDNLLSINPNVKDTESWKALSAIYDLDLIKQLLRVKNENRPEIFEQCHSELVEKGQIHKLDASIGLSVFAWIIGIPKKSLETYVNENGLVITELYEGSRLSDEETEEVLNDFFTADHYMAQDRLDLTLKYWEKAANKGDKEAIQNLENCYRDTVKDYEAAKKWAQKGADAGDIDMMGELGLMYFEYFNDPNNAEKWLLKAAYSGGPTHKFNLGSLYKEKFHDYENAKKWFLKSANQGFTPAMTSLGEIYQDQFNNVKKAKEWFDKAANLGDGEAAFYLGMIYFDQNDLESAFKWLQFSADAGITQAMHNLGSIYQWDYKDYDKAKEFFYKEFKSGDNKGAYDLGNLYYNTGEYGKAKKWFKQAASTGDVAAMNNLGIMIFEKNKKGAGYWWLKAAKGGNPNAMFNLASLYNITFKDYKKAEKWYLRAARSGHALAPMELARLYRGPLKDLAKAKKWSKKAAQSDKL